jgi:hypothetical protein
MIQQRLGRYFHNYYRVYSKPGMEQNRAVESTKLTEIYALHLTGIE